MEQKWEIRHKICMVTGANVGIGKETARALASAGARVIMVCRSRTRGEAARAEIIEQSGNDEVELMLADLSVQADVRKLAAAFQRQHEALHVLVNNAGAYFPQRTESADGLEMTWALNHLGYFLLTNLLLDVIKRSAPARIINVSSAGHTHGTIDFDDLQMRRNYGGFQAYARSKLANLLFTYELARRLAGTAVTVNALHPGAVNTNIWNNVDGLLGRLLRAVGKFYFLPVEAGAATAIYLATSPDVTGVTGQYFAKQKAVRSSPGSYRTDVAARLWDVSTAMTGLN
ncbi:MAG: SDR family oxidoreductase [Caldilineaceae bacterium]|nr:SDR family oxidoreductase [Caldilineaceae bacterium]MCB0143730.1 SDR family oxidoreductase [Caldilineaceae bacterium]